MEISATPAGVDVHAGAIQVSVLSSGRRASRGVAAGARNACGEAAGAALEEARGARLAGGVLRGAPDRLRAAASTRGCAGCPAGAPRGTAS